MSSKHRNPNLDLQRLLQGQEFNSKEELEHFMAGLVDKELPSIPPEQQSDEQRAQDLVYGAWELPPGPGKKKIIKALNLDPECIEAWEYMGAREKSPQLSLVFFEKGIAIGRERFGGKYLKQNRGHFWGLHETRPFMRCMEMCAENLYWMEKPREAVALLEELIRLNPGDNQGVRGRLQAWLLELGLVKKAGRYLDLFDEEPSASQLFNRTLHVIVTQGECRAARYRLDLAKRHNEHVVPLLLAAQSLKQSPGHYSPGEMSEAQTYVFHAWRSWRAVDGALDWLKETRTG